MHDEPVAAADEVVEFALVVSVVEPVVVWWAGLCQLTGFWAPGDFDGAWIHSLREPGSTDSTPCKAVNK